MILKIKYLRIYLYNFIQINTAQNLIIDKHLNWNERTDKTVKNRLKSIFAAKKAIGKWELSPANIRWRYTMVIRPKLTYGAVAWRIDLSTRSLKQLNRIQHLILILFTNTHQSTAQEVLNIILDLYRPHQQNS